MDSDGVGDVCDVCQSSPPVRIGVVYYSTIQAAYDNIGGGDIIQTQDEIFIGDLFFDINKSAILEGGYDCDYTDITGKTRINRTMTINTGTATIQSGTYQIQ